MAAADDQALFQDLTRIAATYGWTVLIADRSGPTLRITLEHDKTTNPATVLGTRG